MIKSRLRVILAEKNLNQTDLADLSGIQPAIISRMVTGRAVLINIEKLGRICSALNCQPGDIYIYE